MKYKTIFTLLATIVLFSCQTESNKIENITKIYSYTEHIDTLRIVNISLEETELNFKELAILISKKENVDSFVALNFLDNNLRKTLIPFSDTYGHLGMRNTLRITEDSMLWQYKNPISKLPEALRTHYENNDKNRRYSFSHNRAFTEITIDTSSNGRQLKETLNLLTREFDILNLKHNDSLKLKVYFSFFRQLAPPPPPPPIPKNSTSVISFEN